ncbi:Ankyrin repeat protein [Penicillium sp. IBT 16267x]|nr:Ankyrin repeat protein [Penicillium sp. IBT 16267x]
MSPALLQELHAFCDSGDIQKFREILDSSRSFPDGFDICDLSGIMIEATKRNSTPFIKELLRRGMPVDPLYAFEAIKVKAKDALEAFLNNGWDINQPMSELKPPLLGYAIADEEMTAWLLDHEADPNRQCVIDLTPLSLAVESAPISVIHLILSRGGDVRKGQLLHHAIERQSDIIEVLKLLIEKGAPINATAYEDHPSWALFQFMGLGTPLHRASELGKVDVVRYLISKGADQNIKDAKGRIPLECAQMSNHLEVIEALEKWK